MDKMYEIKMRLCEELDSYAGRNISKAELEVVHMLTDTIKNICKIEMLKGDGYSMDGGWEARGMYSRDDHSYGRNDGMNSWNGNSYDRGYSNTNRGQHWVRGHYSREDGKHRILEDIDMLLEDNGLTATERSALMRAKQTLGK